MDAGMDLQDPKLAELVDTYMRWSRNEGGAGEFDGQELSLYGLRGLCQLDRRDIPEVESSLRAIVAHKDTWNTPRLASRTVTCRAEGRRDVSHLRRRVLLDS